MLIEADNVKLKQEVEMCLIKLNPALRNREADIINYYQSGLDEKFIRWYL